MTEETSEDFLITRLNEMALKPLNDTSPETAIPVRCWGRGSSRPDIADLNLPRFLQLYDRQSNFPNRLNSFPRKLTSKYAENDIMENISKQCENILGISSHQENIAAWLKSRNFETAEVYGGENQFTSNKQNMDYNLIDGHQENIDKSCPITKMDCKTIDEQNVLHKNAQSGSSGRNIYETISCDNTITKQKCFEIKCKKTKKNSSKPISKEYVSLNNRESQEPLIHNNDKYSNHLFDHDKKLEVSDYKEKREIFLNHNSEVESLKTDYEEKNCIVLKNIPPEINEDELNECLNGFGRVEETIIERKGKDIYANVRMANETECNRIIECLDETYAFGMSSSAPIKVYFP